MPAFDYDLFVIGGGSGGVRAARVAAQAGARTCIAEEHRYGGTCVIRGCVPKKLLVYAAEYQHELADAAAYGWNVGEVSFDWATLVANKDREIARLEQIYQNLLDKAGVTIFHSRAVLADPHTVEVDGKRITARIILIATGARPRKLDIPGQEHIISSNEAFDLPSLPARVTLIGGGYITVEFAHIFAGLGAKVTVVHRDSKVLTGFDEDVRTAVMDGLRNHGVELHLESEITAVAQKPDGSLQARLKNGSTLAASTVMAAIGRVPNTSGLGLEAAGVRLDEDSRAVEVDEYSRSSVEHIYAVGDCTDRVNLTPVAIREGQAFVDTVFGNRPTAVNHEYVPTAVFSQPTVGTVGLTEAAAREKVGDVDIYKATFRPLKHALPGRDEKVMMKLVVDASSQRVLGVHMVGRDAAEIIQCMAIAVRMGATKADLDATLAVHPTTAEELVLMRQKVR